MSDVRFVEFVDASSPDERTFFINPEHVNFVRSDREDVTMVRITDGFYKAVKGPLEQVVDRLAPDSISLDYQERVDRLRNRIQDELDEVDLDDPQIQNNHYAKIRGLQLQRDLIKFLDLIDKYLGKAEEDD